MNDTQVHALASAIIEAHMEPRKSAKGLAAPIFLALQVPGFAADLDTLGKPQLVQTIRAYASRRGFRLRQQTLENYVVRVWLEMDQWRERLQ